MYNSPIVTAGAQIHDLNLLPLFSPGLLRHFESQTPPLSPNLFPMLYSPPLPISHQMSEHENDYFDYFYNNVCPRISIVPHIINTFLQTTLQLSLTDEAVLHCLIGWGKIMKQRHLTKRPISGNSCTVGSEFARKL